MRVLMEVLLAIKKVLLRVITVLMVVWLTISVLAIAIE